MTTKHLILLLCLITPFHHAFSRVVSIGGSITEILFELGEEKQLVGRDTTSVFPLETKQIKDLGFYKSLSSEAILALKPKLVLMASSTTNQQVVSDLQRLKIPVHIIDEGKTLEDIPKKIEQIALLMGKTKESENLTENIKQQLKSYLENQPTAPLKIMFLYARGPNQVFVAGKETTAHSMIEAMGFKNSFDQVEGFKPISAEGLAQANPDLILLQEKGFELLQKDLWNIPGLNKTQAYKNQAVLSVDMLAFLSFGPRTIQELTRVRQAAQAFLRP